MAQQRLNVDPFNAGDPVMPWDDPASFHDTCDLGEAPYEAPTKRRTSKRRTNKQRDNYTPPSSKTNTALFESTSRSKKTARFATTAQAREHTRKVFWRIAVIFIAFFIISEFLSCVAMYI